MDQFKRVDISPVIVGDSSGESIPPGMKLPQAIIWGALTVTPTGVTVLTTAFKQLETDARVTFLLFPQLRCLNEGRG